MTWDPSLPADNSKIRNLGTEIRPNWEAIQEGDASFLPEALNLKNRTLLSPTPANPTAIADSYILFSKEDIVSGVPELFGINENSIVTQLTNGAQTIDFNGSSFLPGGLIIKWGTANLSNVDTTITYPTPFPTATFVVTLQLSDVFNAGVENYAYRANAYTAASFKGYYGYNGIRSFVYIALGY